MLWSMNATNGRTEMFNALLDDPTATRMQGALSALRYWLSGLEFLTAALRMCPPREGNNSVLFPANFAAYGPVSQAVKLGLRGYLRSFADSDPVRPGANSSVSELLDLARGKYLHSLVPLSRSEESLLVALPQGDESIISERKRFHPVPHYGFTFDIADRLLAGLLPLCYEVADDDERALVAQGVPVTTGNDDPVAALQSVESMLHLDSDRPPTR